MEWLFPSIVATLAGTLILASTYFYLYSNDRQKFLLIWGIGWLFYAFRFAFMLLLVGGVFKEFSPLLLLANQLCALTSGLLLLHGTFVFTEKAAPNYLLPLAILAVIWILFSSYFKLSFLWTTLPTYLFLGIIYIWTGIVFLRHRSAQETGKTITGWTFILWGIHKVDYPFLRPIIWFAPWGYLIGATMEIVVALGMLIIYFNNSRQELQQSKEKLERSEEKFRALADTSPLAIYMSEGIDQKAEYINPTFTKLFGYTIDEVPTVDHWWPLAYPDEIYRRQVAGEWQSKVSQAIETRSEIEPMEVVVTCKDGSKKHISWGFISLGQQNWACGLDLTESKLAEEKRAALETQLRQAHKMEAVGTMAGGIAHDFNNILAAILGFTEMAMYDTPDNSPAKYQLQQVLKAGNRAKELIKHILSFSRKEAQARVPIDIRQIAIDTIKLLRASTPTTIEFKQHLDPQCGNILADPIQIHQVLINLCTNAAQAMDEEGGVLEVGLTSVKLHSDDLASDPNLKPGDYVQLTVKDSGSGISHLYLDRIFDPYFTTKGVGRGSGMGLAVVIGIVKSHDGMITVNSNPGEGTTFHVYFPKTDEQIQKEIEESFQLPMGNERILVVDDEVTIVDMTKQRIERLGYKVTAKTDSKEALEIFSSQPDAFDLVITDQTMPELTGEQLAKKLLEIRPNIPIILCTGYSSKVDAEKANLIGISGFIMKPVDTKELSLTIREVLNREAN